MYEVTVNDEIKVELEHTHNEFRVNGSPLHLDQVKLNANTSHVLFENRSYTIEMVHFDSQEKAAVVKVNGNRYSVRIKDQFDQLLKQLGMENLAATKIAQIKAPMPGLVLNVLVKEGAEIKKGDNLLVLEAMKMENMIKSPADGVIKKVEVTRGDKVEKNQILISFH